MTQDLIDQLREVPRGKGDSYLSVRGGIQCRTVVPYGNMLNNAADTIEAQARRIEELEVGLANIRRDRDRVVELLVKRTDRLVAAEDERDALRAALKPFQVSIRPEIPDDEVIDTIAHTAGDYRRAAAGGGE